MIKTYGVHDHWTDINKKNDVDIMSVDGVITGIKVNGEDVGGGGESDFSTAEVTIVNTIDYTGVMGFAPVCLEASEGELDEPYSFVEVITTAQSTAINRIILYKGRAILTANNEPSSISGNIEALSGTVYLITGDCTITIS